MRYRLVFILWLVGGVLLLAACGLREENTAPPEEGTAVTIPTPADTPAVEGAATVQPAPPSASPVLTMTVWTIPEISDNLNAPGGDVLATQFDLFDLSHPDVHLQIDQKAVSGQGNIWNYLRSGRGVAPTILPDVVLVSAQQLPDMVAEGLVYPLGAVEEEMVTDLFPVARELVTIEDELYGYPYTINSLDHLVYDGTVITTTLPATWEEMVNVGAGRIVFPAAGPDGAELLLQFYLELGGTLTDAEGNRQLETEPLATALSQFFGAAANIFIVPESRSYNNLDDSWRFFQNNVANIALTDARVMLPQRAQGVTSRFTTIPGMAVPLSPMAGSWVWAVTTADPARQALAVELISWLSSAANMGEWSWQGGYVPSRRSAFNEWPAGDDYYLFVQNQAEMAQPLPAEATTSLLNTLSAALVSVLNGDETPAGAAQIAADAVGP